MLVWILIGAGLVLVVEGLLYALAPSLARQMAEAAARVPPGALRVAGLCRRGGRCAAGGSGTRPWLRSGVWCRVLSGAHRVKLRVATC